VRRNGKVMVKYSIERGRMERAKVSKRQTSEFYASKNSLRMKDLCSERY